MIAARRPRRLTAALAVLLAAAVVTPAAAVGPTAAASTAAPGSGAVHPKAAATGFTRGVASAASYGRSHGVRTAVAVLDTKTGALWTAGVPYQNFISASVVKTMIATQLLLTHRLTGTNKALARKMITQSDNAAATALYPKAGGDKLLAILEKHYHLTPFGHPPVHAMRWGATRITAAGMVRFYNAIRHDPTVWPWLSSAMHAWARTSSAGEPNGFGLAAVAPRSAVKNGWDLGTDTARPKDAEFNTTGFFPGDRYAVTILSEGARSLYLKGGEAIVTAQAYRVFHRGVLPPAPKPVTTIVLDPGHNGGNASHLAQINRQVTAGYGRTKPCNTTGTTTDAGYPEHAFTWAVANQVRHMLAAHHVTVLMTRHSDTGVGPCVDRRAQLESATGVTAAIAFHADGSAAANHGFHLCVDSRRPVGASATTVRRTQRLNAALHSSLAKNSGITVANYVGSNGYYHRDDLAGLNLSTKPTAFLEIGNMRNAGDAAKQSSAAGRTRIARAVTLGILAYLATVAP